MRGLEEADTILMRAGEGSARVTEELALDQGVRDGSEIVRNERTRGPGRERVQGARDELLAGPGLSQDQNGGMASGERANAVAQTTDPAAPSDDPHRLGARTKAVPGQLLERVALGRLGTGCDLPPHVPALSFAMP